MFILRNFIFIIVIAISGSASANWFSSITEIDLIQKIKNTTSIVPEPYRIPITQGSLIPEENIMRLQSGLSKEQVRFLLGSPSFIDAFHENRWDYVYSSRESAKVKNIAIIFTNEKVREIIVDDEIISDIKRLASDKVSKSVPLLKIQDIRKRPSQELVVAKREDFLTLRETNRLPVCIDDEFESYESQRTLVQADEDTLEVRSDEQNQDEAGIFYATGNVEIERSDDLVKSDKAQYDGDTGVLFAEGNVRYLTEDLTLYADKGGYNSQNDTVNFSSTSFYFPDQKKPGKGMADEILIDGDGIVYMTPSSYTTCSINNPDWEFSSSETILYRDSDRGHAYNIFLKYKGVPVLYSPFVSFPLSRERHSGFLLPSIGSSGESGTVFSTPYYFNLSENFDLTITPTNYSGRGQMFEAEFRHKSENSDTVLELANLDNDDIYRKNRHAYFLRDTRTYKNTLVQQDDSWEGTLISSNINVGGISDIAYFDDFGNTVSRVGRTHITRNIILDRLDYNDFGYFKTSIAATDYQLAKESLVEQYRVLPRLNFEYQSEKSDRSFNYNFTGEIADFDHTLPQKATGLRTVLYPSIEYPMSNPGWEINTKFGVRYSNYDLTANDSGITKTSISKTFPIFSVRGKMIYEKVSTNNILQTLEPEMYFLYVPAGNQDDIPIFDSGDIDFKYNLFSENKFYGQDRINDAKQVTLALSSSMINTKSGNELLRATIGQIFYLDDRSVNIENSTTDSKSTSNILGLVNARLDDYWRLTGYSEFSPRGNHAEKNQVRLSYKRPYGKQNQIFNTSYRFSRGQQEELDFSAVLPFNSRTSIIGKINYSFNNRRSNTEDVLEKMIGVEYESCCYGIKLVAREFWNGSKIDDVLYFEFLPKGIATSDNTTAELLRDGILGYQDKFDY
mgnify:FL=1